jgi:hypothetical protein
MVPRTNVKADVQIYSTSKQKSSISKRPGAALAGAATPASTDRASNMAAMILMAILHLFMTMLRPEKCT